MTATLREVREKPILFSGAMVRAILDGTKSQTRRVVKAPDWIKEFGYTCFTPAGSISGRGTYGDEGPAEKFFRCPYGAVGDRLWVRETWSFVVGNGRRYVYRADGAVRDQTYGDVIEMTWKPSIHMPRRLSRITLEIIDVRVERLQRISHEDVLAEGIDRTNSSSMLIARVRYEKLWDSLNATRGYSWDSNPWVWVLSFRRIEQ